MSATIKTRIAGAVIAGLLLAALPGALLAYDSGGDSDGLMAVSQATGTATRTATATSTGTPAAPQTGNAGFLDGPASIVAPAILLVLATSMVAGGRMLSARRRD